MYLDTKGLVALWREALLAKHVLEGKTKGYRNHPQLNRFKTSEDPLGNINHYLSEVLKEGQKRGFRFDPGKIPASSGTNLLKVTSGQLVYEREHLLEKIKKRDPVKYISCKDIVNFSAHPLFRTVEGEIEPWEVIIK